MLCANLILSGLLFNLLRSITHDCTACRLARRFQSFASWPGNVGLGQHLINFLRKSAFDVDVVLGDPLEFSVNSTEKSSPIAPTNKWPGCLAMQRRVGWCRRKCIDSIWHRFYALANRRVANPIDRNTGTKPLSSDHPIAAENIPGSNERKVFIKTYGCQMNVYDSERMGDVLGEEGYAITNNLEDAELVILNTCHIREKAAEKVYSDIGRIRKVKEKRQSNGQQMVIGVTGCVAQAEGKEILARAKVVEFVVGPQTYHRLPDILQRVSNGEKVVDTEYATEDKFEKLPKALAQQIIKRGVTAFLTIQEGCDKFCTFCVVPYTRGSEQSRSPQPNNI